MKANELEVTFPQTIRFPSELGKLCQWTEDNGYPISGYFELCEHEDETIRLWFGSEDAVGDLAQFGSGADGSLYCVWRAPDGTQPIVHLGSEGDAIYVLAPTAVEFLRLLAIGYDEIGFADLESPPVEEDDEENINPAFQRWVTQTFNVTLPAIGAEIVQPDDDKHSRLNAWVQERCG